MLVENVNSPQSFSNSNSVFSFFGLTTLGTFIEFDGLVTNFYLPIILTNAMVLIYGKGNFVYHNLECTSIYHPFRSPQKIPISLVELVEHPPKKKYPPILMKMCTTCIKQCLYIFTREGGDIGLFITLVPKLLQLYFPNNFWD